MIDLKQEIDRELSLIDPPDLWDRIQADATNNGPVAGLDLSPAPRRQRPSLWLAVAAVTVLLALVGASALLDDDQAVDTTPATEVPVAPEPPTTLNIDAFEDGAEIRVGQVTVTIQCTGSRPSTGRDLASRDVILGGVVTANPEGLATLDEVNVAIGDLLALIIREHQSGGRPMTLYHPSLWYGEQASEHTGSCSDLVESVPSNLDGGFFHLGIEGGYDIDPGGGSVNP